MSHLIDKSITNSIAAKLLHQKALYSSVIHCSYYSCVQLMKHTWLNSMNRTDDELKRLYNSYKTGSHNVLINEIVNFISTKFQNHKDFNIYILQLKRLRTLADYEEYFIDFESSEKSISLSKLSKKILTKCI